MPQPTDFLSPVATLPQPDLASAFATGLQQSLQMQMARAQLQRQLGNQALLDAAHRDFINNPSPQNIRAIAALDPQGFAAVKQAHDTLSSDQQKQDLQDMTAAAGYLRAGQSDQAKAVVQRRIDAMKAAGQDTRALEQLANTIDQNPGAAKGMIDYSLAAVLGPDKFGEAFPALEKNDRDNELQPGAVAKQSADIAATKATTAKTEADTQTELHPMPKTAVAGTDMYGNPTYYNPNGAPPAGGSGAAASPDLQTFVQKLTMDESGGNPGAKNPNSSATGPGQFLNSTWLGLARQVRPDLANTPDADLLKMRTDPALSAQVTAAYAQQNAQVLQANGLPVNGATLAMAHKLGPNGAHAVLAADPNAKLADVLPPEVIKANPQLAKQTAGQYAQSLAQKFGTYSLQAGPGDPTLTGDAYLATLPPARARQIQAIANGDLPPPTGRAAMTGPGQALLQQVLQYDPTATSINLPVRQQTRIKFTTGTEGQAINSANTVIGHIVSLKLAADQLHNGGLPALNAVSNAVRDSLGDSQRQTALKRFNFFKTAVANELTKVFRGSNGAEADVQGWIKQLSSDNSPAQFEGTVNAMLEGMQSRLESLGSQYSQGMGKAVDGIQLLSPHARQQLQLLRSGQAAVRTPSAQSIALLRQQPNLAAQFDQQYGPGASQRYLGTQ